MEKSSYPFVGTPILTTEQLSKWAELFLATGVIDTGDATVDLNKLEVYADSTGMQVKVKTGKAYIKGHLFWGKTSEEVLAIADADPTNDRIDRVVAQLDWAAGEIDLVVLTGTPGASPVPPTLTTDTAIWEISLAQVAVDAAVVTIAAGDVTDEREFVSAGGDTTRRACGRLTLTNGTPITSSDVTAATAIYWNPFKGDQLPIYDGSDWSVIEQTALTLSLNNPNHAANTLYDVFYFDDSGTKRIGTGPAWSNSGAGTSSRGTGAGTTELEWLNGYQVNKVSMTVRNGANTYTVDAQKGLYLGTFKTTSTVAQTEDSEERRLLWNMFNRVNRWTNCQDSTSSWTYTTATWRAARANTAVGVARVEVVLGFDDVLVRAINHTQTNNSSMGNWSSIGIGINSTSSNSALIHGGRSDTDGVKLTLALYRGYPGAGYHYIQRLEISQTGGSTTWYGTTVYTVTGMITEHFA